VRHYELELSSPDVEAEQKKKAANNKFKSQIIYFAFSKSSESSSGSGEEIEQFIERSRATREGKLVKIVGKHKFVCF
jgi:hypothetical protein